MADVIKCRWCSFTTLKFKQNKDGTLSSGWRRLEIHIETYHHNEHEQLLNKLAEIDRSE